MLPSFPSEVDPEQVIYHPAEELKHIARQTGGDYDKHESEVEAIMSSLRKENFERLLTSGRCSSFKKFVDALCDH